jgi:hypothetical protein
VRPACMLRHNCMQCFADGMLFCHLIKVVHDAWQPGQCC